MLDERLPLAHSELHHLAVRQFARELSGHLLQLTALVQEADDRLIDQHRTPWRDRAPFFLVGRACEEVPEDLRTSLASVQSD